MSNLHPDGPAHKYYLRRGLHPMWGYSERRLDDGNFEYEVDHLIPPLVNDLVRVEPWRPTITAVAQGIVRIHFKRHTPNRRPTTEKK